MMSKETIGQYRQFLKDDIRKRVDFSQTQQSRGIAPPPIEKPFEEDALRVALPPFTGIGSMALDRAIARRASRRSYAPSPLSLEELSFLLWATQGIRQKPGQGHALRTVPSAGCRHALETYLAILNIREVAPGIYRYLPLEHEMLFEFSEDHLAVKLIEALFGQSFPATAAVTFVWTALPQRMEWRYGLASHKVIALDAGHVCQNLYLACEAIGAGTCAIAAYDQTAMDRLLRIDGEEEFTIYLAPVGKQR
jgi:SagB-type dehydrogenase family enzyme